MTCEALCLRRRTRQTESDERSRHAQRNGNGRCCLDVGLSLAVYVSPLDAGTDRAGDATEKLVTVQPREIDEVLDNPGMGFADFHFGFGHPLKPDEYPHTTVAYFRWPWAGSWNRRRPVQFCVGGRGDRTEAKAKVRPSPSDRLRI